MKPDALVLGGGPAGTAAAIRLARSGRHVTLYEKSHFPRPKLCGGFMSSEGIAELEELGVLSDLRQRDAVSIHRTVIATLRGTILESPLADEALSVSRDVLDHLLLQAARLSDVEVHEGEDGLPHLSEAPLAVVAGGRRFSLRNGLLPQRLRPWYASPSTVYFGIQALFENVADVTDQVELDLIQSGYVGLSRQRRGINVCALTTQEAIQRHGPSLDGVLRHFMSENPVLRAHLKNAQRCGPWQSVGSVKLGIRRLTEGSTFYVGDAACVVDPFAGEGMSIGLYTSKLLVRALDQTEAPPAEAYENLWKAAFLPALRWNAAMRMLYSIPLFREPAARVLQLFPQGMPWLTDLTRYRSVAD